MPNFSRFTNPLHEEPDYEKVREIEEIKGDMKLDLEKGDKALQKTGAQAEGIGQFVAAPSSAERATDEQIQSWALRHGLDRSDLSDLRCAWEDARTEAIWATMVDAPAVCNKCHARYISPTTSKTLNRCHCGGELIPQNKHI